MREPIYSGSCLLSPAASASQPGVEGVPDPLPQQVIAEDGDQDGEPRIEAEPPGDVDVVLSRREDVPPARRGRLNPDAEKA